VMLYLDDVPHVEIGVELIRPTVLDGPVIESSLPAGEAAWTVYRGPYEQLGAAHDRVKRWCAEQGRPLAGPKWEIYGDWREDPAELETEVYHLLA
jgi:effector-binding domain-containing protein